MIGFSGSPFARLLIGAAFVAAGCGWSVTVGQEADNSDFVVVSRDAVLPTREINKTQMRRVKPFLEKLPEGYSARIEFVTRAPDGTDGIRYVEQMTSLNPKGKPDGTEVCFSDWYRRPSRVTEYANGVKHGVERFYSKSGDVLLAEVPWENGVLQGVKKTYHETGALASETRYVDGRETGESRSYAADGQVLRVVTFQDGRRHGEMVDYWPGRDRVVKRVVTYDHGIVDGVSKAFYASGKVKWERAFNQNKPHGVEKHYAPDGSVEKERYWLRGEEVARDVYLKKTDAAN